MALTLGTVTFDESNTTVHESYEEVGGRDARRIELSGIIAGEHSAADSEAKLDAILNAASREAYDAELSIRSGRRLWVRRAKFQREICRATFVGSFVLTLEARDPFEESAVSRYFSWDIAASGATKALQAAGNVFSYATVSLWARGDLVNPSISDGTRTLVFSGAVRDGKVLVLDGAKQAVLLDNEDVTCYTTGDFPRIDPEGTTLTFADDASSSHAATASVTYRDRWW